MNGPTLHPTGRVLASSLAVLLLLSLATDAPAQRNLKNIPSPDPEIERKSFQVAPGFEVNLYASDPKIAKPIQMNFDPQGRLWIASSETYPQIKPGQRANDRILVVEDTNGDGTAETRQEITYDAGGRFDTYKVDGNDDGDADGEWDFLLLPATECLQ